MMPNFFGGVDCDYLHVMKERRSGLVVRDADSRLVRRVLQMVIEEIKSPAWLLTFFV